MLWLRAGVDEYSSSRSSITPCVPLQPSRCAPGPCVCGLVSCAVDRNRFARGLRILSPGGGRRRGGGGRCGGRRGRQAKRRSSRGAAARCAGSGTITARRDKRGPVTAGRVGQGMAKSGDGLTPQPGRPSAARRIAARRARGGLLVFRPTCYFYLMKSHQG